MGQRLLVDFWVNPWQNHALGKVSQFQLCNSATPQHTPRTWGVAELELKGFVRLQVPNSATPQLRSTPPHLGSCRVGTQRLCEAPSPQVRNSAAPPPALGELQSWNSKGLRGSKSPSAQLRDSAAPPPHLGSCRVGTQRVCEAPSPQVRNSATPQHPSRTWGVGFGAASVANFGEDGGHYRNRS